jgi:Xaa-Pro aminopeptidase
MRLDRARKIIEAEGKLPYLVTDLVNIQYLTGFDGSNGFLLISEDTFIFITDSRYSEYASELLGNSCELIIQKGAFEDSIKEAADILDSDKIYFEEDTVYCSHYRLISEAVHPKAFDPCGNIIGKMRMVKEAEELDIIEKAAKIADQCTEHIIKVVRPGMTEWDLSVEIEHFYRTHGCRRSSFDTIVASGSGSSMPHYIPSMNKKIGQGEPLMVDMGCLFDGYNSDLTRTFFVNSVSADFERIYAIVLAAQLKAVSAVKPGMTTGELDKIARDHISDNGYGDMFGHSLGHGIGLQVHELPSVRKDGDVVLQPGMVITIEPGIYIPEKGGVRIEDMVVVEENGARILTGFTKNCTLI